MGFIRVTMLINSLHSILEKIKNINDKPTINLKKKDSFVFTHSPHLIMTFLTMRYIQIPRICSTCVVNANNVRLLSSTYIVYF